MSKKALDTFGFILMNQVRDKSIFEWDGIVDGRMKGLTAEYVKRSLEQFDMPQIEVLHNLIPKIVDTTIHNILWMLEQEKSVVVSVHMDSESIKDINEISDGLTGELYGQHGWIARFSKQGRASH